MLKCRIISHPERWTGQAARGAREQGSALHTRKQTRLVDLDSTMSVESRYTTDDEDASGLLLTTIIG